MLADVAIVRKGCEFTSHTFNECLNILNWAEKDQALQFFIGLSMFGCLCPTLNRGEYQCLKMVWRNDDYELDVWLYPGKKSIKYAVGRISDESFHVLETTNDDALTLLEYWAAYLNQDDRNDSSKYDAS